MPARCVRLGAIDVTCFKNALEACNAVLLVELWALRKVCHAIEVLDREKIRPAFCPSRHDLRRHDFCEMP